MNQIIGKILIAAALAIPFARSIAKADDAASAPKPAVTFGGFFDSYFAYDQDYPSIHERPYTTQPMYSDGPRVNLAVADAKLDTTDYRGRVALQAGDSVKLNYAAEPDEFFQFIQEANFGYRLAEGLWIDAGIYLSHIGFESFNSKDDYNYTRSLVADYSPYYESGVKLSYAIDEQWSAQLHLLHGWQNISDDQDAALGMQVSYLPTATSQLTYNNFLGDQHGFRNFHDFIGKVDLTDDLSVALQVDVGNQNLADGGGNVWWHGWSLMSRYKLTPKLAIGSRVERYSDPHQVLITTLSGESYRVTALSANVDYELYSGLFWRTEYRVFFNENKVFPQSSSDGFTQNDYLLTTSLAYNFTLGGIY